MTPQTNDFINNLKNPKPETVTPTPGTPGETPQPEGNGSSAISATELLNTGSSAENSNNSGTSGTPGTSATPAPGTGTTTQPNTGKVISIGGLVSGTTAVDLMDSIFPALIVAALSFVGYQLDKKGLGLTAKEKEVIAPFMQQCLNAMQFNLNNPFYNLLFVLAAIYGTKIISELPKITKTPKADKKKETPVETAINTIKEKEDKEKQIEDERKKFIAIVKPMHYQTAIKYIKDQKKMSNDKAVNWYNKFVKNAA